MIEEWSRNNKRRRERQLRSIKQGESGSGALQRPFGRGMEWTVDSPPSGDVFWKTLKPAQNKETRWLNQWLASGALLVLTFLVFHSTAPALKPAEQFVSDTFTRDFNFRGLAAWYKESVGGSPSIFPAFLEQKTRTSGMSWAAPVSGKTVLPFDDKRKGVVIRSDFRKPVNAAAEGWVIFTGYKEGLGNTVIVRHAAGDETWYGWLGRIDVKEKDWVKAGQKLGEVGGTGGQPLVYIALRQNSSFVNPAGVIPFD
jgi:stage IV sporulation protein FA